MLSKNKFGKLRFPQQRLAPVQQAERRHAELDLCLNYRVGAARGIPCEALVFSPLQNFANIWIIPFGIEISHA